MIKYFGAKKHNIRKQIISKMWEKWVIWLHQTRSGKIYDNQQVQKASSAKYISHEVITEIHLDSQRLHNEFNNVHLPYKRLEGYGLTQQQK